MKTLVKKYKYRNSVIEIHQDEYPQDPREWDCLGKMVCFHKKYDLGDKTDLKSYDFPSWNKLKNNLIKDEKAEIVLPLYLYDHSGITISTSQFSCKWDSGQVGFIYITKEQIKNSFNVKKITKKILTKAIEILKYEVKTYDQYLKGEVYSYRYYKLKKCKCCSNVSKEEIDSTCGFFGTLTLENVAENCANINIKKFKEVDV